MKSHSVKGKLPNSLALMLTHEAFVTYLLSVCMPLNIIRMIVIINS